MRHLDTETLDFLCTHLAHHLNVPEDTFLFLAVELADRSRERMALAEIAGKQTAPEPTRIDPVDVDEALAALLDPGTPLAQEPRAADLLDEDGWYRHTNGKLRMQKRRGVSGSEALCTDCGGLFVPKHRRIKRCPSCCANRRKK